MAKCEVCGNEYDQLIEIKTSGDSQVHHFDCFECAIHQLAPKCSECGVRVLGHGVEIADELFCGAHCARARGYTHAVDHVDIELAMPN